MRQTHYSDNQYYYTQKWSKGVCLQNIFDYSPFGAALDGRTMQGDGYRYGFNGMEKDDEVKGAGNSYDFGARIYDSRVGRWLSRDALSGKYPDLSNYNLVFNCPIIFIDPDGRDVIPVGKNAERVWTNFYNLSSPETKAKLDLLEASDIIYEIKYIVVEGTEGEGMTSMNKINEKGANKVTITLWIPKEVDEKKKLAFEANIIGDEAETAYQFEKGEIGYIQKKGKDVEITGYDYLDEIKTKEASANASLSQGLEPLSSTKDYKEKVIDGGMDSKEWIKTFKNDKEMSYSDFMDLDALNNSIKGNEVSPNKTVESAKNDKSLQKFIYRKDGKSVTSGKSDKQ
jgi:RHS repeat-associated protein